MFYFLFQSHSVYLPVFHCLFHCGYNSSFYYLTLSLCLSVFQLYLYPFDYSYVDPLKPPVYFSVSPPLCIFHTLFAFFVF